MDKQNANIKVNIKILPFGQSEIVIKGKEDVKEDEQKRIEIHPDYSEIETTVPKKFDLSFEESSFIVPQTTCYL